MPTPRFYEQLDARLSPARARCRKRRALVRARGHRAIGGTRRSRGNTAARDRPSMGGARDDRSSNAANAGGHGGFLLRQDPGRPGDRPRELRLCVQSEQYPGIRDSRRSVRDGLSEKPILGPVARRRMHRRVRDHGTWRRKRCAGARDGRAQGRGRLAPERREVMDHEQSACRRDPGAGSNRFRRAGIGEVSSSTCRSRASRDCRLMRRV